MIDYIVLCEFDINEGSIIRHTHPSSIPAVEPGIIASYMLPEGGHNRPADSTYFILNRKKGKDLQFTLQKILGDQLAYLNSKYCTQQRIQQIRQMALKKGPEVRLHQILDLKWVNFYNEQEQRQLTMKLILRGEKDFAIQIADTTNDKNLSLEVRSHPYINIEIVGDNKFTMQNEKGNVFGIEIVKSNDFNLKEFCNALKFTPYMAVEEELNSGGAGTLYFLSIMKNKLDTQAKRGAIVKAIAFGSKYKHVESFKGVINNLLDAIFENEDLQKSPEENLIKTKQIITQCFIAANSQDIKELIPDSDFMKRRLYSQIGKNLSGGSNQNIYKQVQKNFNGKELKICVNQLMNFDDIATISVKQFIMKFGEKTMLIYDAILSEKRILFSGGLEFSADKIQEYVFACASLVSPPLVGILQQLHPYAALSNLDFIEETGYIAGVTNPMFKQRQNWHDVCCEIDIGKLKVSKNKDFYNYEQEKYYNLDMDFIRAIISRIKQSSINDEEIKRAFESYTLLMLDLALKEENMKVEELTHENDRLSDLLQMRIKRFQKTNLYRIQKFLCRFKDLDSKSNIQLSLIETLLRRLRLAESITDAEALTIYSQINRYLQDSDSVSKLLYLLPNCRESIACIANGMFSPNEDIERFCTEILRKIEMTEAGKLALSNLNYFLMMKLQQNLFQKELKSQQQIA